MKLKFWAKPLLAALLLATASCAHAGFGYDKDTIWDAASQGDLAKVQQMLDANGQLLNAKYGKLPDTPLDAAARSGKVEVFKYLLARGAKLNTDTIMLYAAGCGNMEIIRMAADKGADINARHPGDAATPLMRAAFNPRLEVIQFLLDKGADGKAKDNFGNTALINAGGGAAFDVLRLLVKQGGNVKDKNARGRTVLLNAARAARPEVIDYLLSLDADAKVSDVDGITVLHELCSKDELTGTELLVAQTLVKKGAPINALDRLFKNQSRTPLDVLLAKWRPPDGKVKADQIESFLRSKGAKTSKELNSETTAQPVPQPAPVQNLPAPRPGEILFAGSVISVDVAKKQLVLNATSFSSLLRPQREDQTFDPPTEAIVHLTDAAVIHLPGKTDKLSLGDVKAGEFITAMGGQDAGSDKQIWAREIIVGRQLPGPPPGAAATVQTAPQPAARPLSAPKAVSIRARAITDTTAGTVSASGANALAAGEIQLRGAITAINTHAQSLEIRVL